jgi:PAS domain-containing protein
MVLLSVVTLGFYPAVWYLRRQPFFDGLGTGTVLGSLPRVFIGVQLVAIVAQVALAMADAPPAASNGLNGGIAAVNLILSFRAAEILRKAILRKRVLLEISSVGVFFLGSLYLQHKINQAADAIERLPKRKKSKAAAPTEPARAEDQPDDDVGSEEADEAGR